MEVISGVEMDVMKCQYFNEVDEIIYEVVHRYTFLMFNVTMIILFPTHQYTISK